VNSLKHDRLSADKTALIQMLTFLLTAAVALWSCGAHAQPEAIEPNDNLVPAGSTLGNVLSINLVAEEGMWYPGGTDKPGAVMQAFREENGPLQTPGPMIRVPQGTRINATIRNAISGSELHFHGFQARPATSDDYLIIPFGETRSVAFQTGEAGVYYYWASTQGREMSTRALLDSQLTGVIVIDPADDRIDGKFLVIGESFPLPDKREHTFNGRSFPNTEHMEVEVGGVNRWHFVNASFGSHPLHLHGTFYRVTHEGDLLTYQRKDPALQDEVVTYNVGKGNTMTMEWVADRPGNWLFHCHISAHVAADSGRLSSGDDVAVVHTGMGLHEMAGMTLAIEAIDKSGNANSAPAISAREITMLMQRQENYFGDNIAYAIAFSEHGEEPPAPIAPGPLLVLEQDQPANITLVNQTGEATSIHWHGMELESYYDGVAGFSGIGSSVTPAILPGESFVARMTPPRPGTYIYHTHMDDRTQLIRGLYGALIVSGPTYPYEPDVDQVFVFGLAGNAVRTGPRVEGMVINGRNDYAVDLPGLRTYRLRLINITANNGELIVRLVAAPEVQTWTPIGKDGAQLPRGLQLPRMAMDQSISVGETYDFSWTPQQPGTYWLEARRQTGEWLSQARMTVLPESR